MTVAEAREEIVILTAANRAPVLDTETIDLLLREAKRASQPFAAGVLTGVPQNNNIQIVPRVGTIPPDTFEDWQAGATYAVGDQAVPAIRNGHFYEVTVGGIAGLTEPDFPTDEGATVVDGAVTWQEAGAALWVPTFALARSVSKGWRIKAGLVAADYDFRTDDQSFSRSQMLKAMLEMAKVWASYNSGTIELQGSLRARRIAGLPTGNNDWLWNDDDEPLAGPSQGFAVGNVGGGRTVWSDDY